MTERKIATEAQRTQRNVLARSCHCERSDAISRSGDRRSSRGIAMLSQPRDCFVVPPSSSLLAMTRQPVIASGATQSPDLAIDRLAQECQCLTRRGIASSSLLAMTPLWQAQGETTGETHSRYTTDTGSARRTRGVRAVASRAGRVCAEGGGSAHDSAHNSREGGSGSDRRSEGRRAHDSANSGSNRCREGRRAHDSAHDGGKWRADESHHCDGLRTQYAVRAVLRRGG